MASRAVYDAVAARLAAGWSNCPVRDPDQTGDAPADNSAFLDVQFPVANEDHIGLGRVGERTYRESGGIRFVLNVPRGNGWREQGLGWADDLRALFRGAQFSGITCIAASPPVLDDGNDNGAYQQLRVIVEYYFDLLA